MTLSAGLRMATNSSEPAGREISVSVRNATKTIGSLEILRNISLEVRDLEFVSIVGASGCGKTTLLNIIAGLTDVSDGVVDVLGKPPREGRHDIAYMLARDGLLSWRTALANAEFGAEMRGESSAVRRERALGLLASVGLKGFESAYPSALSHGMRQRVALARTFCLSSQLLLMDEPFGALDAQTKLQLQDVLLSLWSNERRTVVFITHDLSEAILLSDRVVIMSARPGRIVADVPITLHRPRSAKALQRDPAFHKLYAEIWDKLEESLTQ